MSRRSEHLHLRVGDEERAAAVECLDVHAKAGRLGEAEYRQRREWALEAGTRLDIHAIFHDLPKPHPELSATEPPGTRPAVIETPLGNTMAVIAGILLVLGTPAAVIIGVVSGVWWILTAVLGAAILSFMVTMFVTKHE